MSKAFTRESDDAPELPVRRPPTGPQPPDAGNPITPDGAARLKAELARLVEVERPSLSAVPQEDRASLPALEQRIHALEQSLQSAVIVPPPDPPDDVVRFGATVTVQDARGERWSCRIVGAVEAVPEEDRISWRSPLASALLHARLGTSVDVALPAGTQTLKILEIAYE
jgi:transcription elongation factor GreB